MNLFKALEAASLRLNQNDPEFDSQANLTTDILRSAGVYPHRRSSLMVMCISFSVLPSSTSTSKTHLWMSQHEGQGRLPLYGYSTKLPSYLTKAVKLGFLTSQNGKATGKLELSELLEAYLDEAQAVLA